MTASQAAASDQIDFNPVSYQCQYLCVLILIASLLSGQATAAEETGWTLEPGNIATGRFSYITSLNIGDIHSEIESVREIRADSVDGQASLSVQTTNVTGMGETVDLLHLHAGSLYPLKRLIIQGDGRMELDYSSDKVTGMIRAAGQLISVNLELAEPAYAGDAGLDTLLGGMPLRAGLRGQLQAVETEVDVYVQRFSFQVDPPELIVTPAGAFESWPIKLQALDDADYRQTIWISTASPRLFVQAEAPIPVEAGGGVVRTQLVEKDFLR